MIFQSPSNRIAAQKFLRASMKGYTTFISITQLIAHICCNLWCSHCDVSGSTTVVTYDGCIKNHARAYPSLPTLPLEVASVRC